MAAGTGLGWFWRMQFLKTRCESSPDQSPGLSVEVSPENPAESHLEEVIHLRERVKSLEYLDEYHRDQLHQKDLLVQELMGTVNRLAVALPEGKKPEEAARRRGWWPWRRSG